MSEKSEIKCTTQRCRDSIAKYGERYHRVYDRGDDRGKPSFMPDAIAQCEGCGGYTNGTTWKHTCQKCGKDVDPGQLTGLFVPHLCHDCERTIAEKEKTSGNVCLMCRQPRSRCCC